MVRQRHGGMMARVTDNGAVSEASTVTNGVKQGCVLAPTLFSLKLSVTLMDACRDKRLGMRVACRTNGQLLNQRWVRFQSRVFTTTVHELLFIDDCVLKIIPGGDMQGSMDLFAAARDNFGLITNMEKTVVMHQPPPEVAHVAPHINSNGAQLQAVDNSPARATFATAAPVPTTTAHNPNQCIQKRHQRPNLTGPKFWRALPYVKNVSEAVSCLLTPLGDGVAHRPEATIRHQVMRPKDPLPRQETSGVVYRIWCSCGQSNYAGEPGRLLRTRIAEHAAAVWRGDASSQVAAHSTAPGHIFRFQEAEILARGDNRVSRELLESWFSGLQSINKHNDLPLPYSVLRFSRGRGISHVGRARASNYPSDSEPICRAIVTPASDTDDEIMAINDSDAD
ncbi:hypothetical protein SprV_0702439000 [Sparganum proliferum]